MSDDNAAISKQLIVNLARLSMLDVDDAEVERLRTEVGDILKTIAHLQVLDIGDVDPTLHPVPLEGNVREDQVGDALDRETFLAQAPESNEDGVVVPRVVG